MCFSTGKLNNMLNTFPSIDKKNLRHDCIHNIENMDLELGVSGVYLHLQFTT